jgi:hypothetical protein
MVGIMQNFVVRNSKFSPNPSIKRDALKRAAPYVQRYASGGRVNIIKSFVIAVASFLAFANANAEDFDSAIINTVTPNGVEWSSKNDDPTATALAAFGVKRFNWIANDGRDRIILFIDPRSTEAPSFSRESDVRAGAKNCKDFSSKTEIGSESDPFLGWVSACTLASGNVMTLRHFAFNHDKVGYKISRIWREQPSNESVAQWSGIVNGVVAQLGKLK